jgi:hypothetical protein
MALARQRDEWARVGVTVAYLVNHNGFTRQPIQPKDVIPAVFRLPEPPAPPKSPEEVESESRRGWKLVDQFMRQKRGRTIRPKSVKREG